MWRSSKARVFVAAVVIACAGSAASAENQITERQKPPRNLAILIFPGVQIIDYTGPYEVFGHVYAADQPVPFNTYTVAERAEPLTTAMGMSVNPKYSIDNAPRPDILVVPGGHIQEALNSQKVLQWVRNSSQGAEIVMSVCNGAFILARAGLLDGLEATTTATLIEQLREAAPRTRVVSDKRFVDNGKIVTTAGLSSGIDGSLHIIERLYGSGTAEMAALGMEYNWDPESKYVRAALADKYLPNQYDIESVTTSWVPLTRGGGVERWESKWSVTSVASSASLLHRVEDAFSRAAYFPRAPHIKWEKLSETNSADGSKSLWRFSDEKGDPWVGAVNVESTAGRRQEYVVSVRVSKAPQE